MERELERINLFTACRRFVEAYQERVEEKELRALENIIAMSAIPLSFMNDLEKAEEEEHADTN